MGRRPPSKDLHVSLPTDTLGRVQETKGSHIFAVATPDGSVVEAILPNRFRAQIWIRRGSFVVLRVLAAAELPSIVHILDRDDIKEYKRSGKWPEAFITDSIGTSENISAAHEGPSDPQDSHESDQES